MPLLKHVLIPPDRIDAHERLAAFGMIVGIVGIITCLAIHSTLVLTFMNLTLVGAAACALQKWRRQCGLWMLAALFFVLLAAFCTMYLLILVVPSWRGSKPASIMLTIDHFATIAALGHGVLLIGNVGRHNWRLTRSEECYHAP